MRNLFLVALLVLVGCGETKVVEKEVIKEIIIDNTKTPVSTKVYGKHVLVTYDDGSTAWAHPESFKPIEDLGAHIANADQFLANHNFGSSCFPQAPCKIAKYETLLGKGWVVVEFTFAADPVYRAYNLDNLDGDWNYINPADGEVLIYSVNQVELLDNGVFGLNGTSIFGRYNFGSFDGTSGNFSTNASLGSPISWNIYKNDVYLEFNGSGTSVGAATEAQLGIDSLNPEDFYLSQDTDSKKDLENIASAIETEELTQYGLSTKTAKMVKTLAKTAGKRALTSREKDLFAKELIGMSFDKAAEMMVEDYEGLIEKAADLNETSPEAIKELINTIM